MTIGASYRYAEPFLNFTIAFERGVAGKIFALAFDLDVIRPFGGGGRQISVLIGQHALFFPAGVESLRQIVVIRILLSLFGGAPRSDGSTVPCRFARIFLTAAGTRNLRGEKQNHKKLCRVLFFYVSSPFRFLIFVVLCRSHASL